MEKGRFGENAQRTLYVGRIVLVFSSSFSFPFIVGIWDDVQLSSVRLGLALY